MVTYPQGRTSVEASLKCVPHSDAPPRPTPTFRPGTPETRDAFRASGTTRDAFVFDLSLSETQWTTKKTCPSGTEGTLFNHLLRYVRENAGSSACVEKDAKKRPSCPCTPPLRGTFSTGRSAQ